MNTIHLITVERTIDYYGGTKTFKASQRGYIHRTKNGRERTTHYRDISNASVKRILKIQRKPAAIDKRSRNQDIPF